MKTQPSRPTPELKQRIIDCIVETVHKEGIGSFIYNVSQAFRAEGSHPEVHRLILAVAELCEGTESISYAEAEALLAHEVDDVQQRIVMLREVVAISQKAPVTGEHLDCFLLELGHAYKKSGNMKSAAVAYLDGIERAIRFSKTTDSAEQLYDYYATEEICDVLSHGGFQEKASLLKSWFDHWPTREALKATWGKFVKEWQRAGTAVRA